MPNGNPNEAVKLPFPEKFFSFSDFMPEKDRVHVGTILLSKGPKSTDTLWKVVRIKSRFLGKSAGKHIFKDVQEVRLGDDELFLEYVGGGTKPAKSTMRRIRFKTSRFYSGWIVKS